MRTGTEVIILKNEEWGVGPETERLVDSVSRVEDQQMVVLRPKALEEYIGQNKIKESLQISILACKMRGDVLDHVLLVGPPGLGKTTLANVIAHEMEANIHITVSYTHLRAHETPEHLVCRLLLEKKKQYSQQHEI